MPLMHNLLFLVGLPSLISISCYTAYAGWAITAGNAHGKSRPEVGSGFPIDAYGNRGVSRPSLICGSSDLKISPLSTFWGPYTTFNRLLYVARTNIHRMVTNIIQGLLP